jgi:hypothetical protein
MTDNPYRDFVNSMSPAELKAFLRKITGPDRRTLLGREREDMMLILAFKEPTSSSNNQHTWCDVYIHGDKEYHLTSFPGSDRDADILEEILPDTQ